MERIHEGIGSKFSMLTQYISTFFSGLIIGLYVNWRLTLLILCIAPFLIIVSGAIAMVKYNSHNNILNSEHSKTCITFIMYLFEFFLYNLLL